MKSAFVSLLHYHAGKSLMQPSHNFYQPLSLEKQPLNCQIAREGGFLGKSFPSKSVAWWGEVWHCGEKCGRFTARGGGEKQGQQAWLALASLSPAFFLPCPLVCVDSTLQRLKDHINSDIAFKGSGDPGNYFLFVCIAVLAALLVLWCLSWIHIIGDRGQYWHGSHFDSRVISFIWADWRCVLNNDDH